MAAVRWRKKPVVVDAMLFDGSSESAHTCASWANSSPDRDAWVESYATGRKVALRTLEGTMHADAGDYIIRGIKGEFYPCKPDIFAATYEPVGIQEAKE